MVQKWYRKKRKPPAGELPKVFEGNIKLIRGY